MSKERDAIVARLREMQALLKAEKRSFSAEEKAEFEALSVKLKDNKQERNMPNIFERALENKGKQVKIERDFTPIVAGTTNTAGLVAGTYNPLTVKLAEPTIYDKIGVQLQWGLSTDAKNFNWPVETATGDAVIIADGAELEECNYAVQNKFVLPQRLGYLKTVTRMGQDLSAIDLEAAVKNNAVSVINRGVNKIICSPVQVTGTDLKGPFVDKLATATLLTTTPGWAELLQLKGQLKAAGVSEDRIVWVMSHSQANYFKATPKYVSTGDEAVGTLGFVLEDGKIDGNPVFETAEMAVTDASTSTTTEYVGIGDFGYQPAGFFNQSNIMVEYQPKKDADEITLNAYLSTLTLDGDAFALGKVANS